MMRVKINNYNGIITLLLVLTVTKNYNAENCNYNHTKLFWYSDPHCAKNYDKGNCVFTCSPIVAGLVPFIIFFVSPTPCSR